MDDKALLSFQRQQIKLLREEKAAAMEALDLARELGSFAAGSSPQYSRVDLLREICVRANRMIPFQYTGIYLVDNENHDFVQAFSYPENSGGIIEREIDSLIADQSFAYTLQSDVPVFFLDSTKSNYLLLHPLASPYRVRGMFVGIMFQSKEDILDTTLKLFSVVMLSAVNALENLETHEFMRTHTQELEQRVHERTLELADAYDRLNTTLNGMQTGVIVIEADTHIIVDANPAALELLGTEWNEIIGRECFGLICTLEKGNCPMTDLGLDEHRGECIVKRSDGTEIPIHKVVSRVMINGKLHLVENILDITEQKKLEDLKEHVQMIMRHDLKGPLNGVINLPELLLMDDNLTGDQRELISYIRSSGFKLLNMINMSLDLYKMETGNYDYNPSPSDLISVIKSVKTDLLEKLEKKFLQIHIFYDGNEISERCTVNFHCEEFLLYSLLSNLLKNAVEASPANEEIRVEIVSGPESMRLRIQNRGAVPESIRKNLFDKYVTAGKSGGTGLGTYSAKLITETMGGRISLESSDGESASILIEFPVSVVCDCPE